MMKQFECIFVLLVPVLLVVFSISMAACGGSSDAPASDTPAASSKTKVEKVRGWQQASYENYRFSLPKDWKGDGDTGIWCPRDQSLDMGRPKVSLHCGGIPVMPGSSIEDRLKFYYGAAPTTRGKVNRCGMKGMFVEVTVSGLKHMGLILIEEAGPMKGLNFFDCQAPVDEFDKQKETFKKILDSVG